MMSPALIGMMLFMAIATMSADQIGAYLGRDWGANARARTISLNGRMHRATIQAAAIAISEGASASRHCFSTSCQSSRAAANMQISTRATSIPPLIKDCGRTNLFTAIPACSLVRHSRLRQK